MMQWCNERTLSSTVAFFFLGCSGCFLGGMVAVMEYYAKEKRYVQGARGKDW